MKKLLLVLLLLSLNLTLAAQTSVSATSPQSATQTQAKVSRTSKAINFGRAGSTKLDLHGTDSMPRGYGELRIQSKNGRVEVDAKVGALDQASRFGLEYLTYVLWAVSPRDAPQSRRARPRRTRIEQAQSHHRIADLRIARHRRTVLRRHATEQPRRP